MTYRYRFISEHAVLYGVSRLCRVLAVRRRQGYYEWRTAQTARQRLADRDEELAGEIRTIHGAHRGAYGAPRVTAELRRRGCVVNRKRVARVMRERHIVGLTRRRRRSLTIADRRLPPAPDLVRREFTAASPGRRLVGDITYLPTAEGWLYLATTIDLFNREVVGYAMANHQRAELVSAAIELAADRGLIATDAIFHSDRGTQYTSAHFRAALAKHHIRPSMGRAGSCYDNAVAESFFASLKTETGRAAWATRAHARHDVLAYLTYYNNQRLHSAIGYRTPREARHHHRTTTK
jgi:transposase InsO family protein